jgi:hypothetical protein
MVQSLMAHYSSRGMGYRRSRLPGIGPAANLESAHKRRFLARWGTRQMRASDSQVIFHGLALPTQ